MGTDDGTQGPRADNGEVDGRHERMIA